MAQASDSWSPPALRPGTSVYHYADPSGLVGILENWELWATEASGLNDTSELAHRRKVVVRLLSGLTERDRDDETVEDLLGATTDEHAARRELQTTYLLRALPARDDAAQPRPYEGRRAGYALHLDTSEPLRVIRRTDPPAETSEPDDPSGFVLLLRRAR